MYIDGTIHLKMSTMELPCADLGAECCVPDLLGENILQNRLRFDLDEDDEVYDGYGRVENGYPYRQFNQYGGALHPRRVRTAVLENRYLRAEFLPDFGGRLWSLVDKESGKNLLYTNDCLQFRNLAVRNAWFSGGVEWNVGVIGHTPFTTAPLYVGVLKNEKGNDVLRMYEFERIRKVCYQMDFWLDQEDRALNCRMRITNDNDTVVPMYWWSNMAVPEFEGGRIIVPADKAYTNSRGVVYKVDIPWVNGVDVTRYNGIPGCVDYFFALDEDSPRYIANVDSSGEGLLQLSTCRLQSRKLFSWGHTQGSRHWQRYLTKNAGDYIEIQAGLAKTQYGCIPMAPHTAWEWMEQYGPVGLDHLEEDNRTLSDRLSRNLIDRAEKLEERLKQTRAMAKTPCRVLSTASGYGAFADHKLSAHLEFTAEDSRLKVWQAFPDTGILPEPDPKTIPDEFPLRDDIFRKLEETAPSSGNWYANYQLGVYYCSVKDYGKAEEQLKRSYDLAPNAWACHGLACGRYMRGDTAGAIPWIMAGLKLEGQNISYLKEMFRLLLLCQGFAEILTAYDSLDEAGKANDRLCFYRIAALHGLGRDEEARCLLEQGLEMTDTREGEGSVQQLWIELHPDGTPVPDCYRFDAGV